MEKPEDKIMNEVETPERNRDWMESVKVPVPLNELMKMKDKIFELEKALDASGRELKKVDDKYWEQRSKTSKAEEKYEALKKDYQKLLGIDEEGEKDDE